MYILTLWLKMMYNQLKLITLVWDTGCWDYWKKKNEKKREKKEEGNKESLKNIRVKDIIRTEMKLK